MHSTQSHNALRYVRDACRSYQQELIGEEPLLIRIEDKPYSVVMRTPGEEIFHAAGFCLSEGLVDRPDDLATVGYCHQMDSNVVDIRLHPERVKKVFSLLQRRGFISQTSCGICGKELLEDLSQILSPIIDENRIHVREAIASVDQLVQGQNLYKMTRGSHAAMLMDSQLKVLSLAEDVGRHNALDKAIGKAFMSQQLENAQLAVLSSRISYELVQKAGRAGLSILLSMSRPTALAVELGEKLNMSLACTGDKAELLVFCGNERFIRE
jgi:FdhD protein